MDTDSTTIVDYKIIDVYPAEEIPYEYENLKQEDNLQNYERKNLEVNESRLTLQFDKCNIKDISIYVVQAEKIGIQLIPFDQDMNEILFQRRPTYVMNMVYSFNFKPNSTYQCKIEIHTKERAFNLKSIILKSQPYSNISQIQNGQRQKKAVEQRQERIRTNPNPFDNQIGRYPVQGLNHPPKINVKIQNQILDKKEQEQKEMKLQQFVRESSSTPIHIKGQKSQSLDKDQKPIKQLNKNNDLNVGQAAGIGGVQNQKKQLVEKQLVERQAQKPLEDNKQFQNLSVRPQDVQVNQYKTVVKNTQNSRGLDMIQKVQKNDELDKKKKQQQEEEEQRQRKVNNKNVQSKQTQKQKEPKAKKVEQQVQEKKEIDAEDMSTLHPSDVSPKLLEFDKGMAKGLLLKYRALAGLKFFINQQNVDDDKLNYYRERITKNGGKIEVKIGEHTNYILSEHVIPGVEIQSQKYISFKFLDELKPKEKPQFEKYYVN